MRRLTISPAVPLAAPRTATPQGSITSQRRLTPHGMVGDGFIGTAPATCHDPPPPLHPDRPSPRTKRFAGLLSGLILLQLMAGLVNLVLLAPVWMQLLHLLLADSLWIALVLLSANTFAASQTGYRLQEEPSPLGPVIHTHVSD